MPVYKYLDLSTAHVTEAEMAAIQANWPALDDSGPRVICHDYGAWVNVLGDLYDTEPAMREHYPNFMRCLHLARAKGCNWINFDADAGCEPGLPTHDW